MPPKPQNDFPSHPVSRRWLQLAHARMEEKKLDQVTLWKAMEAHVICSESAVSNLLTGKVKASALVEAAHRVFGWPKPALAEDSLDGEQDDQCAAIVGIYQRMSEKGRKALAEIAADLLKVYEEKTEQGS